MTAMHDKEDGKLVVLILTFANTNLFCCYFTDDDNKQEEHVEGHVVDEEAYNQQLECNYKECWKIQGAP